MKNTFCYVMVQTTLGDKTVTLNFEKGEWLRNDEIDGGEWIPTPAEVIGYLESLISGVDDGRQ